MARKLLKRDSQQMTDEFREHIVELGLKLNALRRLYKEKMIDEQTYIDSMFKVMEIKKE